MALILMTGMCSYQDLMVRHSSKDAIAYYPFAPKRETKREVMQAFRSVRNTGNYLISEAAYHVFESDIVEYMPFWYLAQHIADVDFVTRLKARYNACLFVTANILNADFDLKQEVHVLTSLDMTTIFMSIGIQRRSDLEKSLSSSTLRFIDFLKRPNSHCFTRGAHAANFLRLHRVPNVYEACCPSAFHYSENIIASLRALATLEMKNVEELWLNGYFKETANGARVINEALGLSQSIAYVIQDEPLLYDTFSKDEDDAAIYSDATGELHIKAFPDDRVITKPRTVDFLTFFSPSEWRKRAFSADLSIGRRFHGNLVVMQARKPAVFIAHDDRVREMLDAASLPYILPESWDNSTDKLACIEQFLGNIEVEKVIDGYSSKREVFRNYVQSIKL